MNIVINGREMGARLRVKKHLAKTKKEVELASPYVEIERPQYTCELRSTCSSLTSRGYSITGQLNDILRALGMAEFTQEDEKLVCEYIVGKNQFQGLVYDPDDMSKVIAKIGYIDFIETPITSVDLLMKAEEFANKNKDSEITL